MMRSKCNSIKCKKVKYQAKIDLENKNNSHTLFFDIIHSHASEKKLKILEVGCSTGYLGEALVRENHEVWGVEPSIEAAEKAKKVLHSVHNCFIDEFFSKHSDLSFDVITYGDVLEHLVDPEKVLKQSANFLAPGGIVVASIPNVAHYAIRAMLLEGRWDYSDLGLMDRTHLRFFTRATAVDLFSQAGYNINSLNSVKVFLDDESHIGNLNLSDKSIDHVLEFSTDSFGNDFQYIISASPSIKNKNTLIDNDFFKSGDELRVLGLVNDSEAVITKLRLSNPLKQWAKSFGGSVRIENLFDADEKSINWADVLIFQRISSQYALKLISEAQSIGKKVVFEIDDLLTEIPDFLAHHKKKSIHLESNIKQTLPIVDAISVSSAVLASKLKKYSNCIYTTPNYTKPAPFSALHQDVSADKVKLIIASSDCVIIDMVIEPIKRLQKEFGLEVIAIGLPGEKLSSNGVNVRQFPIMRHKEFKVLIASINNGIGVIPLDDSEFSSCKSAVKYFDYSVCGVPSVCSNVSPYTEVIDNGETGYLVENTFNGWEVALRQLILSYQLRQYIANQAKESVLKHHNIEISANSWKKLFSKLNVVVDRSKNHPKLTRTPRAGVFFIIRGIVKNLTRPSAYVKAINTIRRHGINGLYRKILRAFP